MSAPPATDASHTEPTTLEADLPDVNVEVVFSRYRATSVQLMTAVPTGVRGVEDLPLVLYMHGRDGMHPTPVPHDTLAALERGHRSGKIPPFGFVVAEAGYNPYYFDGSLNGDLLSMFMEEVPGWLRERGFTHNKGVPTACAGISTGGFGTLRYAIERSRVDDPVSAVAVLAPALLANWEDVREKNAFSSEEQWRENDPLQHIDDLGGEVPIGAWIGDADGFREGLDQLLAAHENTPVLEVLPGGHEPAVFDVVGPGMVDFLATGIPRSG
ncbi:alpha/beta hydrolase-fold protein [Parasphingorhabdus pacifica]